MRTVLLVFLLSFSAHEYSTECESLIQTASTYSETDDLNQKIENEFGSDYSIADWTELEAISDINAWISCMGLTNNDAFMVTKDGKYFYDGHRQYYAQYYESGNTPTGFTVHDQIGDYLYLGSWYRLNNTILAKK